MSYNGVGLSTPRGSGTNGHIQRNSSHLRARDPRPPQGGFDFSSGPSGFASRAPDAGILDHERRRRVEVQCLELQVRLEDDGLTEDVIEGKVDELRKKLLAESERSGGQERSGPIKAHERHELAQAKKVDDERLRKALGISEDHVEGRAFDREEQERQKEIRKAEWARKDEERRVRQEEKRKHQEEVEKLKKKHELEKDKIRREYERRDDRDAPSRRSRSPDAEPSSRRRPRDSRSVSPPPRRRGLSPSRSPPRSRSPSPRRRSGRRSPSRSRSISRSPSPRAGRSPYAKRGRSPSYSRSPSRSRSLSRSKSPPRRRARDD